MTELNFRLSETAQERSILLLSKASGVPVKAIERLQAPLQAEEITEEILQYLTAISKVLDVSISELLTNQESEPMLVQTILQVVHQSGITVSSEPVERFVRGESDNKQEFINICDLVTWC